MADDLQREGEALDLEDDWADVRPAPDPEDVLRWAAEDAAPSPNPCAEIDVPRDGIDQLAQNLGVDREILTSGDIIGDGPRTISVWFRTALAGRQPIMSQTGDHGYDLQLWEGRVIFQADQQMLTTHRTFNDGEWHHVMIVGTRAIYVDGALAGFRTDEAASLEQGPPTSASLDELAVWDRELSPAEAQALYNQGQPLDITGDEGLSEGLVAFHRMGDLLPTPFDEPLTTETVVGFEKIKAMHDCKGLEDGEVCPICGRVYVRPRSRYELLMNDEG